MDFAPQSLVTREKDWAWEDRIPDDSRTPPRQKSPNQTPVNNAIQPPRDLISRFRKGTPRSRGGCITCKARHVKCDETKPWCKKCNNSGRQCEYAVPPPTKQTKRKSGAATPPGVQTMEPGVQNMEPFIIQYQPSIDIPGSQSERRSFHFIQAKNLTETFGRCEIDLWDTTMLLYSHSSPTVRTSLLALSAIYEVYEAKIFLDDRTPVSFGCLETHAFEQYTKAVSEIIRTRRSHAKNPRNNQQDLLLGYLIFTWMEIMLGNLDTAKWHLDSGIKIMTDIATNPAAVAERRDPDDVYGALHRSFLRLKFQTTVGLQAIPMVAHGPPNQPPNVVLAAVNEQEIPTPTLMIGPQSAQVPKMELTWTLEGRHRQFERLLRADQAISLKPLNAVDEADRKRSLALVYIKLSRAMLSLLTEARFQGADNLQTCRYIEIIDIMEDIARRKIYMEPSPTSLDFGVIPPLFLILRWCNDFGVRFRAMELLKLVPSREGCWYRDDIVALVEQKSLFWPV
ncbi:Zn2/Cys6 DNA-binding protein [Glarea lozoyensis ATCC 20868]|uniref:Zn2/Cys6 DNA-binding protein n=1 Tax=Glarea lozoyensis (strain ATCC 20868 / MF5171) TaxID=1116229 RepID=S3DAN6_GLAL2|nr:Zn2/Cys6 DNA-binding protein [Glarea lozoyensis ATCC 20868]EPE34179.1 Zn2/Cys6 DNA-binding protein [Glarea lozoyensis ATCC 20868]